MVGWFTTALCTASPSSQDPIAERSLSWLEQRLTDIDMELSQLARFSIRSGTGSVGYRSTFTEEEDHSEWLEVNLSSEVQLDEVFLVPVIRRDAQQGFQADGFPRRLRLYAGTDEDRKGELIAAYTDEHYLPRIAPLLIPCHGIKASWIRIETKHLSRRPFDNQIAFQLSEVMAFSGKKNVALHQPVRTQSNSKSFRSWSVRFITDGSVPYLMDAASGEKSIAYISPYPVNKTPSLNIDLGTPQTIDTLHLHALETSDILPQSLPSDFGIPREMTLFGADQPDYTDEHPLLKIHLNTIYEMAPIMMWSFSAPPHRYFRLTIDSPAMDPRYAATINLSKANHLSRFGFAEIELVSDGINRARGKPVSGTNLIQNPNRELSALTDGSNVYGTILPIRDWMEQLSRRHDLETERPLIEQELYLRHEQQKTHLRRLSWLSALLAVAIGFTILIDRMLRMHQIRRIEQRFAADLHDELGANLHTIGLLSDLAEESKSNPAELQLFHQRIRAVTERSGIAVQHCTDMLSAKGLHQGLLMDMRVAAERILHKRTHEMTIEGEEYLEQLNQRTCFDLFMFYKECLINISRHSGATWLSTKLIIMPDEIKLTITDNGRGLPQTKGNGVPSSLKRRARLLGAHIQIHHPQTGGTCIKLNHKIRKRYCLMKRGNR